MSFGQLKCPPTLSLQWKSSIRSNTEGYRRLLLTTLIGYRGRYLVRGGEAVSLESAAPGRMVIGKFPTLTRAKARRGPQRSMRR